MSHFRRGALLLSLVLLLALIVLITTTAANAGFQPENEIYSSSDHWKDILRSSLVIDTQIEPEQDTCQHCHISGTIENLWVPLTRWSVFGVAGLIFAFGFYKSGSVWASRERWKPLWIRAGEWLDERYRFLEPLKEILSKPVPIFATKWMYCLGGITFALFVIQGITGTLLAFYYKPTPEDAYASIQAIETQVQFGASIRAIHHWSANGMIIMCVAHLLRVFITGAFKPPRELNWISGVLLFIITFGFGFTGYLLPWDQRAFWATTVGTEIGGGIPWIGDLALVFLRGAWDVGAVTLSRFYAMHVLVLPLAIVVLLGMHFIMIRRQGIARPL